MKTPYFLLDEKILNKNILAFQEALKTYWPNSIIGYSVKTNSLPWILSHMKEEGLLAEVVSDEEYKIARLSGFKENEIIYNGPIKSEKLLLGALEAGSIVNIDSEKELDAILRSDIEINNNIGIRVNISTKLFKSGDVGYLEDGFRFGFSNKNGRLDKAIELLKEKGIDKLGLHFHCNSINRSIDVYSTISKYAKQIIKKHNLTPAYIDIGGGFFGGIPNKPGAKEYISEIKDILGEVVNIDETKLIIEPGSAIIGSAMELHTTVVDIKDTELSRIVTTDGSRLHIDPLWKKNQYEYVIENKVSEYNTIEKQVVCGYTCMDHDRIMLLKNREELRVGNKIIYKNVGAYSVTLGGAFIKFLPDVYLNKDGETKLIRKQMSPQQYYKIQTNI